MKVTSFVVISTLIFLGINQDGYNVASAFGGGRGQDNTKKRDFYKILGIPRSANAKSIKKAFK
jgi:hypothetical protein